MKRRLVSTVILALGVSCISFAQSQDNIAKQFVGMWRFASWPQRLADGTTRQSPQSIGYLIYSDTNHVCYVNMDPNRPKWKSTTPNESEALSGIMGLGAYCGTFEIHASEGFVLHQIEIERSPNNVGIVRKRWFTFNGPNRLSLRIDTAELNASTVESTLIWERVTK